MRLIQHDQATTQEPRYNAETLGKVTALAQRLQSERQETLTAGEMEQIGAEVGLQPIVVREALQRVAGTRPSAKRTVKAQSSHLRRSITTAWWATVWMLPPLLALLALPLLQHSDTPAPVILIILLGWATYIGGGIILSGWAKEGEATAASAPTNQPLSRHDLLDALFTLQHVLEGQKEHRAFLSVDVVGSTEMKRGESELAVEYSFNELQTWLADTARAYGGEMHSAAGDGMMCVFRDDAAALRAARALQQGVEHFNRGRNRLSAPFRLRCGVTAGEVAVDPDASVGSIHSAVIDRAAYLQKHAQPGDIIVGGKLASHGARGVGWAGARWGVPFRRARLLLARRRAPHRLSRSLSCPTGRTRSSSL